MAEHGKAYEVEIYGGVGHAFMYRADDPDSAPAYGAAGHAAWARVKRILAEIE